LKTKQICCRGERIGDIELKGGALDFGKLARLVCQQTQRFNKNSDSEPTKKKELLCFVPKAS
jgi:hypothetical protein